MRIEVNGDPAVVPDQVTIRELLAIRQVRMPEYVTVQLNGEFVPSAKLSEIVLSDGDTVEFVYFMGGGEA